MVQLVAALLLGVAMTLRLGTLGAYLAAALPVYIHLLVFGWATQMIFGVAYWMFPRPAPERAAGNPVLGWICFASLNAGLLVRAFAEPVLAVRAGTWSRFGLLVAAALQFLAAVIFVALTWRRVASR